MVLAVLLMIPVARADEAAEEAATPLVGWIELSGTLREAPTPFAWVTEADAGPSLPGLIDQLELIRDDATYRGVVLFLDQPMLTLTQCTAIADTLEELRAAGKTVMTFAETYTLTDYLIASAADEVLLQKKGELYLNGLAIEEMYLAGMLEKIGVRPDLLQVGKYKGADETLMRRGPSEAWDENIKGLLDGLYDQTVDRIAAARGMDRAELEKLMADGWTLTDEQLVERNAVDRLVDRDLLSATEPAFGDTWDWDTELGQKTSDLDMSNPFAVFSTLFAEPTRQTDKPTLAVIHADGPITSGESSIGDGLFSDASIGSATMIRALEDALLDEQVKGVVLRLDSPGGSALASEVIWQSLRELGNDKPVVAVVGSMAASGGYYIVSGADEVYVQPHSILGSIGVVGGKITLGGLYDWAGIDVVRRSRGPGGELFNSVEPFTEPQRAEVRRALTLVYDQFVERVELGRGDRLPDVSQVAEGRLFVGSAAVENGMADKLGGVDDALGDLADRLGLAEGEYDVIDLPGPMSLGDYLDGLFGVRGPAVSQALGTDAPAVLQAAERLLGPVAWQSVSRTLSGLMLLRDEPVLMLMPSAIVVR
ncbi:MAG: S49 family peptidase [Planctomycetota bacterium]